MLEYNGGLIGANRNTLAGIGVGVRTMQAHTVHRRGNFQVWDSDAWEYVKAVESADGDVLEAGVRTAIDAFVRGCKSDGIWNSIKASCILAGARTLSGALVPLVGTAPTNYNFVAGDHNRKTGLVGDGSTKYLDSNTTATATSASDYHQATYVSVKPTAGGTFIRSDNLTNERYLLYFNIAADETRAISGTQPNAYLGGTGSLEIGFKGVSRDNSSTFDARANSTTSTVSAPAGASTALTSFIFAANVNGSASNQSNPGLAFYSIGESLDLALLDARVTALINAIGAAS